MSHVLEVKNLSKSFKKNFWSSRSLILKNLSFVVPQSVTMGFLGANGSGKTTTFKCLLELIKRDSGSVYFFGQPLSLKARSRIGFLPERPQFYEELTAKECLYFYVSLHKPLSSVLKSQIDESLRELDLYKWGDKKLKTFSKGMLQKIGIIQALIHEPQLLILDEPFSGLDPESRLKVIELLERNVQRGCSLFLSSHIFQDIERLCNRLLIIKEGSSIFEGSFYDFQKETEVGRKNILYLLKDKKQSLKAQTQADCQKHLKRLLSQGAVILSVQSECGNLEQRYKELMKVQ